MKKIGALLVLTFMAAAFIVPSQMEGGSRGIEVVSKGGQKLYLYKDYYALIMGVRDYDHWPDLPGAEQDAKEMAESLRGLGFKVKLVTNSTSVQLKEALNDLAYKVGREKDRAILFYFAGHGHTEVLANQEKLGYIIPKDCPLLEFDAAGFVNKAISMKMVESYALRIRSKHVLMVFDSCFSGSVFASVRAAPTDISEKSAMAVRQFITAGNEDEQVPDRSVFKICFIDGIQGEADLNKDGYVTGSEIGMYLDTQVVNYSNGSQHPQYGKIRDPRLDKGDFVFHLGKVRAGQSPSSSSFLEAEIQRLSKERAKIERERRELEQLKVLNEESEKLGAERRYFDVEKEKLAKVKQSLPSLKKTFYVQLASIKSSIDAKEMVKALKRKGYTAEYKEMGEWLRVFVGPFADKDLALMMKEKLEMEGFKGLLIREL